MFQSSKSHLRRWLDLVDDLLADHPEEWRSDGVAAPHALHRGAARPSAEPADVHHHPHRRPLRWEHQRRPGSLPAPPVHCISPIRSEAPSARPARTEAALR